MQSHKSVQKIKLYMQLEGTENT